MNTLTKAEVVPEPVAAEVTSDTLRVDLADGRSITVPLLWFPRLRHGSVQERANFELGRNGIHWPDLDEDIPVAGLLNGEKSGESLGSIQRWLESRQRGRARAGTKSLAGIEAEIERLPIYRAKHPVSQKLLSEVIKFVYARFGLLPEPTKSGHLLYQPQHFLHLETVAKRRPSLTINLIGPPSAYRTVPGMETLLVAPRTGQTRLRLTRTNDLDSVFRAIELAHKRVRE